MNRDKLAEVIKEALAPIIETKILHADFVNPISYSVADRVSRALQKQKKSWTEETLENLTPLECPQKDIHNCNYWTHGITIYIHTSGEFFEKAHCNNCGFTWDVEITKTRTITKMRVGNCGQIIDWVLPKDEAIKAIAQLMAKEFCSFAMSEQGEQATLCEKIYKAVKG